jgi:hypothetical protein
VSGMDYPGEPEGSGWQVTGEELSEHDKALVDAAVSDALGIDHPETCSVEVQELTNEWLDLSLRLELLNDQKATWLTEWKSDESKVKKRIKEITTQLREMRSGRTEPQQSVQETQPKQMGLPGVCS